MLAVPISPYCHDSMRTFKIKVDKVTVKMSFFYTGTLSEVSPSSHLRSMLVDYSDPIAL